LQKPADLRPGSIYDEPKACPRSASLVWPPDLRRKFTAQLDLRRIEGRPAARFDLRRTEGLPSICVVSLGPDLRRTESLLASSRAQLDLRRNEGLPSICVVRGAASLRAPLDLRRIEGRPAARFDLRRTEGLPSICVVSLGPDLRRTESLPASLRAQLDLRRIEGRFASPDRSSSPVCRLFELRRTECFSANQVVT
jgi:hypothetical protein